MAYNVTFTIADFGRQAFEASTLAGLSSAWRDFVDASNIGSSDVRSGGRITGGDSVGWHMSYNGKVWRGRGRIGADDLLFDPYASPDIHENLDNLETEPGVQS